MKINKLSPEMTSGLFALAFFAVSLVLNWSSFFPTLGDINPWDEAAYVKSGMNLLNGEIPIFAGSPFTAFMYAVTNLTFSSSPFWMIHSVAAGRLIAFTLIWISGYLIARSLSPRTIPLVLIGMYLGAPFFIKMLRFPSDPFFMSLGGLGLWQLLTFNDKQRVSHAVLASIFIALAASARNDGLILFFAALGWLTIRVMVKKASWLLIASFVIPFGLIVGGYVLFYGNQTGTYSLGTAERTYDNFEAGQIAIYSGAEGLNSAVDAKREARRIFGTPEENDYSVLKAILRNPPVFFERVRSVSLGLPSQIIKAYSGKWVVLLAFWASWGVVTLLRRRDWAILILLLLWFTPFLSGFIITIFRTGHLLFPSLVVLSLASIGLYDYAKGCNGRTKYLFGFIGMLLLLLLGAVTKEVVVLIATGLSLIAMLLIRVGQAIRPEWKDRTLFPLLLFLVVGIILHGPYPGIEKPKVKLPAAEQALLTMLNTLPEGARVLAGSPGVVYAAKMTYLGLASTDVPIFSTATDFSHWLGAQNIDAVYIDETMISDNNAYWVLLQELKGSFEVAYSDENGETQVWIWRAD